MSWTAAVLPVLERWGYVGLGVGVFLESAGVPVPGETALIAAGIAAASGVLSLPVVVAVAGVASVLGDNLGFLLGRRLGREWLASRGRRIRITPARLARVDAFFDRYGPVAVALARFVAGVRVVVAFVAGTTRMAWPTFLRWNVLGAFVWATVIASLAYGAAKGYAGVAALGAHAGAVALGVAVAIGIVAWLVVRRRRAVARGGETGQSVQR